MRQVNKKELLRIIDANFNRAKEGLRVVEDTFRFLLNEKSLTQRCQRLLHHLTNVLGSLKLKELNSARNVATDIGRPAKTIEFKRRNIDDIVYANLQRVKESLRVLEEFSKLIDKKLSAKVKDLRYQIYALEKDALKKL